MAKATNGPRPEAVQVGEVEIKKGMGGGVSRESPFGGRGAPPAQSVPASPSPSNSGKGK